MNVKHFENIFSKQYINLAHNKQKVPFLWMKNMYFLGYQICFDLFLRLTISLNFVFLYIWLSLSVAPLSSSPSFYSGIYPLHYKQDYASPRVVVTHHYCQNNDDYKTRLSKNWGPYYSPSTCNYAKTIHKDSTH